MKPFVLAKAHELRHTWENLLAQISSTAAQLRAEASLQSYYQTHTGGPFFIPHSSNLIAMASTLLAMASNLIVV